MRRSCLRYARKWLAHCGFAFVFSSAAASGAARAAPELWFAPMDPVLRPVFGSGGSVDFLDLFTAAAPWTHAAGYVGAFKLYPQFLGKNSDDDDLRPVVSDLKRRGIALVVETGLLPPQPACGHIEGYDANLIVEARRIQRLGGEIAYMDADEPLYFGHSFGGKDACRDSVSDLAQQAAAMARAFRGVFPNAKFLDTEPISNFTEPNWVDLIANWHAAFAEAFGEPFYAFDLDVNWRQRWQERVRAIAARLRLEHMPIGLICNGDPKEETDEAWITHALRRCDEFETVTGASPDMVVFQSWVPRPTHVLPETAPDSFTHLILEYVDEHHLPPARPDVP